MTFPPTKSSPKSGGAIVFLRETDKRQTSTRRFVRQAVRAGAEGKGKRIGFTGVEPSKFNALRDKWIKEAAGKNLPKIAHKIAGLLPMHVSRKYGYAWPTDQQFADEIKCSIRTVGKGMLALEKSGLIERETTFRQGRTLEANGRLRRIWLTLPSERNVASDAVNGPLPSVTGPNQASERPTGGHIYLTHTPDADLGLLNMKVGVYAPTRVALQPEPFPVPPDEATAFTMLRALRAFPFDHSKLVAAWLAGKLYPEQLLACIPCDLASFCIENPMLLTSFMRGQIGISELQSSQELRRTRTGQ